MLTLKLFLSRSSIRNFFKALWKLH
jgi:hypothetical protein